MNVTSAPPKNRTVLTAFANPASSGSNALIAAPSTATVAIRVLSVALVTTGAQSVKFLTAATDISATFPLAANGGLVLPYNEHGWFQCAAGEALNINLSSASAVGVQIQYMVL